MSQRKRPTFDLMLVEMTIKMVALFPWQQQFSKLEVQIFGSFASAFENPVFRKNLLNLTNTILHIILQEAFPLFSNV